MDPELLSELKDLKKKNPMGFLTKIATYQKKDPVLYQEILEHFKVTEMKDAPPDLMRAGDKPGPLNIAPQEMSSNSIIKNDLNFDWGLIAVILGLFLLITVFIILFMIS
ncbi:MAG: hypothetical protein JW791_04095 [Nanoarchaeota archaeon]|nr:hypothetical protein [Nanoarchaeota archaeon]